MGEEIKSNTEKKKFDVLQDLNIEDAYLLHGKVIHYVRDSSDFKGWVSIHVALFEEFLKNSMD